MGAHCDANQERLSCVSEQVPFDEGFRHYRVLAEGLAEHRDAETRQAVLRGLDSVRPGSRPELKAAWAGKAMEWLDASLVAAHGGIFEWERMSYLRPRGPAIRRASPEQLPSLPL